MKHDVRILPTATPNPGKTLFLLGQAEDGPVNTPMPIASLAEAESLFKTGNLIDAYTQVENVSGITVYLMRITGEYARVAVLGEIGGLVVPVITLRSVYGGEKYNTIYVYTHTIQRDGVDVRALTIEPPDKELSGRTYVLDDYNTIYELLYDINRDTRARQNWVYASSEHTYASPSCLGILNETPTAMTGGDDGLNLTKDDLYIALDNTYRILEGREMDVICPYPVRFDDTHPAYYYGNDKAVYGKATYGSKDFLGLVDVDNGNRRVSFHEQLINFCKGQERFGMTTHGVIGLREVENPTSQSPYYISRLLNATAFNDRYGLVEFIDGAWYDKGQYISVFSYDLVFGGTLIANGCAMYAGMIASLEPNQTTSNRPIPPDIELRFELDAEELKDLSSIGAVAIRRSVKNGLVITNGITASLPDSMFHSIQNIRMVQFTLYIVNQVLEEMVGETYIPVVTTKEVERKLQSALLHCITLQILKDFEYNVRFDGYTQGMTVELTLFPRNTVESVNAKAQFKFDNGGES